MLEPPPCLACGTCCYSDLPTYVRVTGDDYARLGDQAPELTFFEGNRAYMRMAAGHCVGLDTDAASSLHVCRVYANRPETCRELSRGSSACDGEIAMKRERPLLALGRARLAASGVVFPPRA